MLRCVVQPVANVLGTGSTTIVWNVQDTASVQQSRIDFDAEQSSGSGAYSFQVATGARFSYFPGSHINLAGLIMILTGSAIFQVDSDAQGGLYTVSYSATPTFSANIARTQEIADGERHLVVDQERRDRPRVDDRLDSGRYRRTDHRVPYQRGVGKRCCSLDSRHLPPQRQPHHHIHLGRHQLEREEPLPERHSVGWSGVAIADPLAGCRQHHRRNGHRLVHHDGRPVPSGRPVAVVVAWDGLNNSGSAVTYLYRLYIGSGSAAATSALSIATSSARWGAQGEFFIPIPTLGTPRAWGSF